MDDVARKPGPKTQALGWNLDGQVATELAIRALKEGRDIERAIRCLMLAREDLRQEAGLIEEFLTGASHDA